MFVLIVSTCLTLWGTAESFWKWPYHFSFFNDTGIFTQFIFEFGSTSSDPSAVFSWGSLADRLAKEKQSIHLHGVPLTGETSVRSNSSVVVLSSGFYSIFNRVQHLCREITGEKECSFHLLRAANYGKVNPRKENSNGVRLVLGLSVGWWVSSKKSNNKKAPNKLFCL